MSEFSESYHLRGTSQQEAVDLLTHAGLAGYVFPAANGWVSFLAEGTPFVPDDDLIEENTGTLLHWVYADAGWDFRIYQGAKLLHEYSCTWDDYIDYEGVPSHIQLKRALGLDLPLLKGPPGQQILMPESLKEIYNLKPAYAFAQALGLTHYRELAFDQMSMEVARGAALPEGVKAVNI